MTAATKELSLSALRRPAKMVKPSAANLLAIAAPMKSPAPTTATLAFRLTTSAPRFVQRRATAVAYNRPAA